MSLKAELTTWASAIAAYDEQNYELSIAEFEKIADTSKIQWNIGIILATLGQHKEALERFYKATTADIYFAVAYQQAGVSNFMLGQYQAALKDFEDALLYMRGNQTINYEQLGLDFRLYIAEVLFNCGLSKVYVGQVESGLSDMREASTQKVIDEHKVIDDAIRDQGRDYNVFSVPVGVLFKPSQKKLQNLATRDYMGKAILVAATDVNDAYTTFTGVTRLHRGQTPSGTPLDSNHPLSRSASISSIPQPNATTPIVGRMTRSNTVAVLPTITSGATSSSPGSAPPANTTGGSSGNLSRSMTTIRPSVKITTDLPPATRTQSREFYSASALHGGGSDRMFKQPHSALGLSTIPQSQRAPSSVSERSSSAVDQLIKTPIPPERTRLTGVTEIYGEYYQSSNAYEDEIPPNLPPIGGSKRALISPFTAGPARGTEEKIENWANRTRFDATASARSTPVGQESRVNFDRSPNTAASRGAPLVRSQSNAFSASDRGSQYQDGSSGPSLFYDMAKIRVKVNYGSNKRGMSLLPTDTYDSFIQSIRDKFPALNVDSQQDEDTLRVRFRDEDGDMLSMLDEGDFETAIDLPECSLKVEEKGSLRYGSIECT